MFPCFGGEWDFFAHQQAAMHGSLLAAVGDSRNAGDSAVQAA